MRTISSIKVFKLEKIYIYYHDEFNLQIINKIKPYLDYSNKKVIKISLFFTKKNTVHF